ncbi:MAG: hypothetical protein RLZ04_2318 [Actinomycetota bacterium]|jgi:hypothetical protein
MDATADVSAALGTYLEIVDDVAPGLVEGLYVVGSFALGDWITGCSDIDVVVVTAEPATDEDAGSLRTVHALLAERQPTPAVDGVYLAWGDLVVEPATGLHRPWMLGNEFRHDGDCFEVNPITWWQLANVAVTVRGPDPARLGVPTDVEARVRFVVDNLATYWTDVAADVERACAEQPERQFDAASLVWCTLGPLRLHRTAFHGDVVSKAAAGRHGLDEMPSEFRSVIETALGARAAAESGAADATAMLDAAALIRHIADEVARAAR